VAAKTSILLQFDRFLLPTSAVRQSICVQSDFKDIKSPKDCTNGIFFEPTYDPVRRLITYRQSADPMQPSLQPDTTYRLTILPASGEPRAGIEAFDSAPLDKTYRLTFKTALNQNPEDAVDQVPTAGSNEVFCSTVKGALAGCSYANCHKAGDDVGPAEGLDMSSTALISATAIGHVAHGSQTGEHAREGDRSSLRFGRAMPIIDPNFPGNSYILYKLLSNPANTDGLGDDKPSAKEVARLRAAIVTGMPMPPANGFGALKDPATFDALSTWILEGAPAPDPCTPPPASP
jgi:hypothetical protein